jgi:hypothetical protein
MDAVARVRPTIAIRTAASMKVQGRAGEGAFMPKGSWLAAVDRDRCLLVNVRTPVADRM